MVTATPLSQASKSKQQIMRSKRALLILCHSLKNNKTSHKQLEAVTERGQVEILWDARMFYISSLET